MNTKITSKGNNIDTDVDNNNNIKANKKAQVNVTYQRIAPTKMRFTLRPPQLLHARPTRLIQRVLSAATRLNKSIQRLIPMKMHSLYELLDARPDEPTQGLFLSTTRNLGQTQQHHIIPN